MGRFRKCIVLSAIWIPPLRSQEQLQAANLEAQGKDLSRLLRDRDETIDRQEVDGGTGPLYSGGLRL
jgi:hypothetical protein